MNVYRFLVYSTLLLTLFLIALGAYVRLSDAGLGCPDWPGCYGKLTPALAAEPILHAQNSDPTGPVSFRKAWIEMVHRFVASAVGVLSCVLAAMSWANRHRASQGTALAISLVPLVLLQGALGRWTVTLRLQPGVVVAHLAGALLFLAVLICLAQQTRLYASGPGPIAKSARPLRMRYRGLASLALAVVIAQVLLGGWVSANYAALVCLDFPTCQRSWWPPMEWQHSFAGWRVSTDSTSRLSLPQLTAIHMAHRIGAVVVLTVIALLLWQLRKIPDLRLYRYGIGATVCVQCLLGILNVIARLPLAIAVAHTTTAALLLSSVVALNYALWPRDYPLVPGKCN